MNLPLKLKVCGMRDSQNIQELAALNPDFLGFIFYKKSPRFAENELDESVLKNLPSSITKVGVFVNASTAYILKTSKQFEIKFLQLHGKESPEQCKELQELGFTIMKVFSVGEDFDFSILKPYEPFVDYFLFDTKGKHLGGNGYVFDWSILEKYNSAKPIFLSGGIDLENVEKLETLKSLPIEAIDVNSKFEIKPALKNVEKVRQLKEKLAEI